MEPPFPLDVFVRMSEIIPDYRLIEAVSCTCRRFRRLARTIRKQEFAEAPTGDKHDKSHGVYCWGDKVQQKYRYGVLISALNTRRCYSSIEIFLGNITICVHLDDKDVPQDSSDDDPLAVTMIHKKDGWTSFLMTLGPDGIYDRGSKKADLYRDRFREICEIVKGDDDDLVVDSDLMEYLSAMFI